ncbi:MAG TPA: hypothetical protein VN228_04945 [Pyrinomonadaceae bacterium]|nr:hypothetical protein [Pyrinomonadaceae bacterium]
MPQWLFVMVVLERRASPPSATRTAFSRLFQGVGGRRANPDGVNGCRVLGRHSTA